jgi:tetratricopeptide (TPR) repeat protein
MKTTSQVMHAIENQIENGLHELELHDKLEKALKCYRQAESRLTELHIGQDEPEFAEQQRVLSYCLMRQGNILRQLGKPDEALALSEQEIIAARHSADDITLARALMSNGTNLIVSGKIDDGLKLIDEARQVFEQGESYDHRQGLGWYWILQADLANAGLIKKDPVDLENIASQALEILEPLENWPGVARAYAARSIAREKLGDQAGANLDREKQALAQSKIEAEDR